MNFLFNDLNKLLEEERSSEIEVNLYCDEVKNFEDAISKEKWIYIGVIIVPTKKENACIENLNKARFFKEFSPSNDLSKIDNRYFKRNNRIVHFTEMDADMYHIALRWHQYLKHTCSKEELYFNILGICVDRLNEKNFPQKKFEIIYNRFFRTAVVYPLLKYFSKKKAIINEIFHEKGDQQFHKYFPWHSIWKIQKEEKWPIECKNETIKFLSKDHRENEKGNLIQFIDVLLGVTRYAIHYDYKSLKYTKKGRKDFKEELTKVYFPLIERLIKKPDNPNSRTYPNYHKRFNISFFPKKKLFFDSKDADECDKFKKLFNLFYKNVELKFEYRSQLLLPY